MLLSLQPGGHSFLNLLLFAARSGSVCTEQMHLVMALHMLYMQGLDHECLCAHICCRLKTESHASLTSRTLSS